MTCCLPQFICPNVYGLPDDTSYISVVELVNDGDISAQCVQTINNSSASKNIAI